VFAAKPDIVVISTTADSHCELTCAAIAGGAPYVLCEKPMATSLAECDRMIEAAKRRGTRLAVNHPMRFLELYSAPRAAMEAPEFGGMSSMTVVAGHMGMAMNATHIFEAFRLAARAEIAEVTAWFASGALPNPRGAQFEDRAGCVRAVTRSGKRLYLDASPDQGHGERYIYAGPYGQLFVDGISGEMRSSVRCANERSLPSTRYACAEVVDSRALSATDAVAGARAVLSSLFASGDYPTGEDGRAAIQSLVAAYVSDEERHRGVACDSNLPADRKFPWA
jgi:predicted dehydrogenase